MTRNDNAHLARNSTLLIFAVAAATIAGAYGLLPDDRERAAMALRDGHFADALRIFEKTAPTSGDPNTLIALHRLYVHFGDREKAGDALHQFVNQNPDEIWALRELVKHYRQAHDEPRYLDALRQLIERAPDREVFAELMGRYRLNGNIDDEISFFWDGRRLGLIVDDDTVRAGLILASQGKLAEAASLLQSVDLSQDPMQRNVELNLLQILVDLKRFDEAYDIAARIQETTPSNDRSSLPLTFERAGKADYAARLRRAVPARADNPS